MAAPRYPPETPGLFRWTSSTLGDLLKCSTLFHLKRQYRHRATTVRQAAGSGLAAGALVDNLSKMAQGEGARTVDIVDACVEEYKSEIENSEVTDTELEQRQGIDLTAKFGRLYAKEVSPRVKDVVAAEEALLATMGDIELAGTPDVITTQGVEDYKTGGSLWTQAKVDQSLQLSMYSVLYQAHFKRPPELLTIHSINNHSNRAKTSVIHTTRDQADIDSFYQVLQQARRLVDEQIMLPAPAGAWWCTKRWCEMWNRCPYQGGKK